MSKIKITCQTCYSTYESSLTSNAPINAEYMICNWCPECEDRATNYYEEYYFDENDNQINTEL